ncbi:hypothetical protein AAHE18_05G198900 [Arachis hypogaea]
MVMGLRWRPWSRSRRKNVVVVNARANGSSSRSLLSVSGSMMATVGGNAASTMRVVARLLFLSSRMAMAHEWWRRPPFLVRSPSSLLHSLSCRFVCVLCEGKKVNVGGFGGC